MKDTFDNPYSLSLCRAHAHRLGPCPWIPPTWLQARLSEGIHFQPYSEGLLPRDLLSFLRGPLQGAASLKWLLASLSANDLRVRERDQGRHNSVFYDLISGRTYSYFLQNTVDHTDRLWYSVAGCASCKADTIRGAPGGWLPPHLSELLRIQCNSSFKLPPWHIVNGQKKLLISTNIKNNIKQEFLVKKLNILQISKTI